MAQIEDAWLSISSVDSSERSFSTYYVNIFLQGWHLKVKVDVFLCQDFFQVGPQTSTPLLVLEVFEQVLTNVRAFDVRWTAKSDTHAHMLDGAGELTVRGFNKPKQNEQHRCHSQESIAGRGH